MRFAAARTSQEITRKVRDQHCIESLDTKGPEKKWTGLSYHDKDTKKKCVGKPFLKFTEPAPFKRITQSLKARQLNNFAAYEI